jgi:hypothetical protein
MKRNLIFVAILLLLTSYNAFSQKYSFGAKFSPMVSWSVPVNTTNFDYQNDKLKFGIGFGPSLKINMSKNFNTDIGVMFTWQGTRFDQINTIDTLPALSYKFDTKIQYLQIPINFEGKIDLSNDFALSLDFGIIPAINLSSTADVTDNLANNAVVDSDLNIPTSIFNLFLSAGAGVVYRISDDVCLSSIILYNNGIFDVWYDKNSDTYIKQLDMKNHYISMNIGVHIDF